MLTIRLQRRGRSGHAQFRVIVQDSRFHPTRGKVVAYVGNYDPHTKAATLDSQKIGDYLANGAQPSDRVAKLLSKEGIKLPAWYQPAAPKKKAVRNPDKRRSTRPAGAPAPKPKVEIPAEGEAEAPVEKESEVSEPAVEEARPEANQETANPGAAESADQPPAEPAEAEPKVEPEAPSTDQKTAE